MVKYIKQENVVSEINEKPEFTQKDLERDVVCILDGEDNIQLP